VPCFLAVDCCVVSLCVIFRALFLHIVDTRTQPPGYWARVLCFLFFVKLSNSSVASRGAEGFYLSRWMPRQCGWLWPDQEKIPFVMLPLETSSIFSDRPPSGCAHGVKHGCLDGSALHNGLSPPAPSSFPPVKRVAGMFHRAHAERPLLTCLLRRPSSLGLAASSWILFGLLLFPPFFFFLDRSNYVLSSAACSFLSEDHEGLGLQLRLSLSCRCRVLSSPLPQLFPRLSSSGLGARCYFRFRIAIPTIFLF